MQQTDFAKTLVRYLTDFLPGQRNVSPNTVKSYRDTFKQFLTFMQENREIRPERISFAAVTTLSIKDFLHWLENARNVSITTRNQRLAAIHSFFRYAQTEHPEILLESQKIKKKQQQTIPHLSMNQLTYLLIDLKVCEVRLEQPATITLTGKGNKKRNVPILAKTRNNLEGYVTENYLLENGRQQSSQFYNSRYQAFTRPGITYILDKYFKLAKLRHGDKIFPDRLHLHMLRHSKALHLLESGVNLIYIRDLLGHANVTTTEMYLKFDTELKRKASEAAYPQVVSQDAPAWEENNDILQWLQDLCQS